MCKKAILLLGCFLIVLNLGAQNFESFYKYFEIDTSEQLELNLHGDYEIKYYAGNTVGFETTVELTYASKHVLNHFIKLGRYAVEMELGANQATFTHKDLYRGPMSKTAEEIVELIVYIPDTFSTSDNITFRKEKLKAELD